MDYFPYGKVLREYKPGVAERFLTTYHQRDQETGLDYRGARFYDSDIGRFLSLDPEAATYYGWSAYNYVLGNPAKLIDETGRFVVDPKLKQQYPRVAAYIEGIASSYQQKPDYFKRAVRINSGLDDGQISDLLKPNFGALIKFGDLSKVGANGVTDIQVVDVVENKSIVANKKIEFGEIMVGAITLHTDIIQDLEIQLSKAESGVGDALDLKSALLLFESTLYHEFTHFGDVYSDCNMNCTDYTVVKKNGEYKIKIASHGNEGGKKFEIAAYGADISGSNVDSFVKNNAEKTDELLKGTPASE